MYTEPNDEGKALRETAVPGFYESNFEDRTISPSQCGIIEENNTIMRFDKTEKANKEKKA